LAYSGITKDARYSFQVGARLRGEENKFNKVCCFIDAWNLTKNSELKLEQVWMWLPGSEAQYRLKPAEGYEVQVCIYQNFLSFTLL